MRNIDKLSWTVAVVSVALSWQIMAASTGEVEGRSTDQDTMSSAVGEEDTVLQGLVGHWPFDEKKGCLARDHVGPDHGILGPSCPASGLRWAEGRNANALAFDGRSGHVFVPAARNLDTLSALTISAWIRHPPTTKFYAIVDKRDDGTDGFDLYLGPSSRLFMRADSVTLTSKRPVADGTWHHVVGVYDGSEMALYVDGSLDHRAPAGVGDIETTSTLFIGRHFSELDFAYGGSMDEVRIYDRALSGWEIQDLYHQLEGENSRLTEVGSAWQR